MRFFDRPAPKPVDHYEALLQYLDGMHEEIDEARVADMRYGWKLPQGRTEREQMEREEAITIGVVMLLVVVVVSMLLMALQRVA